MVLMLILFKRYVEEVAGLSINWRILSNFRYDDDTVLLAETEQELQYVVNQTNRYSANAA